MLARSEVVDFLILMIPLFIVKKKQAIEALERLNKYFGIEYSINVIEDEVLTREAYLAGFFDAEGSISVRLKENKIAPVVRFRSTDKCIIEYLQDMYKGYIHESKTLKGTVAYDYTLSNEYLEYFINSICRYSIVKRKRLELLKELRELKYTDKYEEKIRLGATIISLNSNKGNHEESKIIQKLVELEEYNLN